MANIRNCGFCPFYEGFLKEWEDGVGLVCKGRCHKWDLDEVWETRTPCHYIEDKNLDELVEEVMGREGAVLCVGSQN